MITSSVHTIPNQHNVIYSKLNQISLLTVDLSPVSHAENDTINNIVRLPDLAYDVFFSWMKVIPLMTTSRLILLVLFPPLFQSFRLKALSTVLVPLHRICLTSLR